MTARFPPRTLAVRLFLLLLAGMLAAVLVTTGLAIQERGHLLRSFREHGAALMVADLLHLLAALPPEQRLAALNALPSGRWQIEPAEEGGAVPPSQPSFTADLAETAGPSIRVEAAWRNHRPECPSDPDACPPTRSLGAVVRFADGQRVRIESLREPPPRPPRHAEFLMNLGITAAIMALVAWFAMRLLLQPLRRLSEAAEAFGRDPEHPPMDESGPAEVRQAMATFNRMRERLRAHIEERTRILAAITHDLKTPLTRMRLRLEQCEDEPLRTRLAEDIAAMQALVNEGLALARSLDSGQPPQVLDLAALLQSLCDDAEDAGADVSFAGPASALVLGRPEALGRSFLNLIDNAVKYGGKVRVSLEREDGFWRVRVRDFGPGIPEAHLEDVLQPFFRLETSRSRATGGTGLGLAIAANLLGTQGGRLSLCNHPEGGLEASVTLPLWRA
jgi:signal transduction histidine kinase